MKYLDLNRIWSYIGARGSGSGGAGYYGGGGSSYTDSTLCDNVTHTQGYQKGAGYITITEIA